MIRTALYGRLGQDPTERTTRSGKAMVTASIAVDVSRAGQDQDTEWFDVAAFGKVGEVLARHAKGELVAVMGVLTRRHYTGNDGAERASWSLTAESLVSARTVRPSGGKRTGSTPQRKPQTQPAELPPGDPVPFNDDVPF